MCFPIPGGAPPLACCSHNFLHLETLPANHLLNQTGAESSGDGGKNDSAQVTGDLSAEVEAGVHPFRSKSERLKPC